jgi:hypothetical protein
MELNHVDVYMEVYEYLKYMHLPISCDYCHEAIWWSDTILWRSMWRFQHTQSANSGLPQAIERAMAVATPNDLQIPCGLLDLKYY